MAKAVVTGGAGFIGSHIVDSLLRAGHQVSVIDDLSSGSRQNLDSKAALHVLDIRSAECRQLLEKEKPEIIVHAAAQMSVRESMRDPHFDVQVNVAGLLNILQAFLEKKLPYFVFLSTGGAIYGEQQQFPAKEDHPISPDSIYGLSKRVSELYLDFWGRKFDLKYCVLRLANIYGPRQNPHGEAGVVAIFNKKLIKGEGATIFGSGEQTRDFTYVGDVAVAVGKVIEGRVPGTFNIGTGHETSVNALYAQICKALNIERDAASGPAQPGEQMRSCIDNSSARNAFGWQPQVQLASGLKLTSDWFKRDVQGANS